MNVPEWLTPSLYGAAIGAATLAIVGFAWGGWVTGGTAKALAAALSRDTLTAAMVPVCLEKASSDPERSAKLETIGAASRFQQRDALMDAGWATMPGSEAPDRDIAAACLEEIDFDAPIPLEVDKG